MAQSSKFCTFYVGKLLFGIPLQSVQEVVRYMEMTPVPLAPKTIRGLINLRGQIVTVIDLRKTLALSSESTPTLRASVVARCADGALSLLVDEIEGVVEVDETTFEPPPETLYEGARSVIIGVHKLENRLMHVLDADKIGSFELTSVS